MVLPMVEMEPVGTSAEFESDTASDHQRTEMTIGCPR
jgi:hypothetical protein